MVEKRGDTCQREEEKKGERSILDLQSLYLCVCRRREEEKSAGLSGGGGAQVWRIVCPATCMHYYRGLQLCAVEIRDGADPLLVSPG